MSKTVIKTYKFRLYPSKSQTAKLENTLELCRELYNAALQERRAAWKLERKSISYFDQQNVLPEIKAVREDLAEIHSQVLQDVLRRLDKGFKSFFSRIKKGEKAGFPRFKGKNRYDSFTFAQSGFALKGNKLHLSKLGVFKIKWHREIVGKIKTLTITRSSTGKWFACFVVETKEEILEPTNRQIGIDVGIKSYAVFSDGSEIANPKFFKRDEKDLAKAQRKKNRKRAAKIHERIKNRRNNFAHQVSRYLVNNFDLIVFEKLRVSNMVKNSKLAKSIADASWNKLFELTLYKAENAGRRMIQVNPRNTSQNCSRCGELVKKDLSVRVHHCTNCGLTLDRDENAALNILALGLQSIGIKSVEVASIN
jgi:putative transposase